MLNRRQTGDAGEQAAADMLQKQGWRILYRNWRHGAWELDIVCEDGDTVVFMEVKTRAAGGLTRPDEALTPAKRATLTKAARAWLAAHDAWHKPCRFDLVCAQGNGQTYTLEHYRDAFDLSQPVGGGNTSWQPW